MLVRTPACTNNPRDAVTIINGGTAAAGTFVVSFASQTQTVSGLGAGQTITLSFAVGVPTTATVNSTNVITESNESNNSFTASLPAPTQAPTCTPTGGPSLTPTRTPTPGCDTLTITGEVYDAAIGTSQGISGATVTAGLSVPRTFSTTTGAGGMYTLVVPTGYGCSVTLLSVQASGYQSVSRTISSSQLVAQPQQNFGLVSLVSATPTRTPTTGPSLTPTRTPTAGPSLTPTHEVNMCTPTSTITVPFTFDGAGTFCWQASALGSYINSWNTTSVTLNGVNVSNLYVGSGSYPAKINGSYYVAYNSSVAWGHFETK